MTFKFPLEKLLNYRISIEEQKKEKLATVQNKQRQLEDELQFTQGEYKLQTNNNPTTKIDVSFFEHQLAYLNYLDMRIMEQTKAVMGNSSKVDKARGEVIKAMKDRKIIEKLKEKQEYNYYKENERVELINLNEIALQKFAKENNS